MTCLTFPLLVWLARMLGSGRWGGGVSIRSEYLGGGQTENNLGKHLCQGRSHNFLAFRSLLGTRQRLLFGVI